MNKQLSQDIIAAYRGWDDLEKGDIIDFDLVSSTKGHALFSSREEVIDELRCLYVRLTPETEEEETIKERIHSSLYYARALQGEEFPLDEYFYHILGVPLRLFTEEEIENQKEPFKELLLEMGYNPKKESIDEFLNGKRVSKKEAQNEVKKCIDELFPCIVDTLGFSGISPDFVYKEVEVDERWAAWINTMPDGNMLIRFNFHPQLKYFKGQLEALSLHEIGGHLTHYKKMQQQIMEGHMDPACGILTVHEPFVSVAEGLAETVQLFLPEVMSELSPYAKLAIAQKSFSLYCQSNAYLWASQGQDTATLVEYMEDHLQQKKTEKFTTMIEQFKQDNAGRPYRMVYGTNIALHKQLHSSLNPEQRIEYVRHVMSNYTTPKQATKLVQELIKTSS